MGMLSEEGDDDEGKRFVDLKKEDEQLFAADLEGMNDGSGVAMGGQMLSFDQSGGEVGNAVVAAADRGSGGDGGGGGGGGCGGGNYLLRADGEGGWPVPASEFEVYGMYEPAEGVVGKDEARIRFPYAAPSSYACAVVADDDELPQNGGESDSRGGSGELP